MKNVTFLSGSVFVMGYKVISAFDIYSLTV